MRSGRSITKIIDGFNEKLGGLTSWLALVIVLLGSINALARFAGKYLGRNLTSNVWLELQWYLFSLIFLFGAAHALRRGDHVKVDIFYGRWSERTRLWIRFWGGLLFLLPVCGLMIWTSWNPVLTSWRIHELSPDPGGLPRYPIKTAIPLAFALLFLQGVSDILHTWDRLHPSSPGEPAP